MRASGGIRLAGELAREAIHALAAGPQPESLGLVETAIVLTAVLVGLPAHVRLEPGKDRK